LVVPRDHGLPEAGVLAAEVIGEADVEAMVEEDDLWLARGQAAHENVAGVRIAVDTGAASVDH
jgi:hypothetical protein